MKGIIRYLLLALLGCAFGVHDKAPPNLPKGEEQATYFSVPEKGGLSEWQKASAKSYPKGEDLKTEWEALKTEFQTLESSRPHKGVDVEQARAEYVERPSYRDKKPHPTLPEREDLNVEVQYADVGVAEIRQGSEEIRQLPDQPPATVTDTGVGAFISANLKVLLFGLVAFIEVIVRLTPTVKDDSVVNLIKNFIDFVVPNRKKDGGSHN